MLSRNALRRLLEKAVGGLGYLLDLGIEEAVFLGYRYILFQICGGSLKPSIVVEALNLYDEKYRLTGILVEGEVGELKDVTINGASRIDKRGGKVRILFEAPSPDDIRRTLRRLGINSPRPCGYTVREELWGDE